jgi:hypothetical protein
MQLTNVAFPRRNTRETGGGQGLWLKVQVYFLLREWKAEGDVLELLELLLGRALGSVLDILISRRKDG